MGSKGRLVPQRVRGGLCFIEEACIEDGFKRNLAEISLHLTRIRVERGNYFADISADLVARLRDLVDHDNIGKLDLIHQQIDECAPVLTVALHAAVGKQIGTAVVG